MCLLDSIFMYNNVFVRVSEGMCVCVFLCWMMKWYLCLNIFSYHPRTLTLLTMINIRLWQFEVLFLAGVVGGEHL